MVRWRTCACEKEREKTKASQAVSCRRFREKIRDRWRGQAARSFCRRAIFLLCSVAFFFGLVRFFRAAATSPKSRLAGNSIPSTRFASMHRRLPCFGHQTSCHGVAALVADAEYSHAIALRPPTGSRVAFFFGLVRFFRAAASASPKAQRMTPQQLRDLSNLTSLALAGRRRTHRPDPRYMQRPARLLPIRYRAGALARRPSHSDTVIPLSSRTLQDFQDNIRTVATPTLLRVVSSTRLCMITFNNITAQKDTGNDSIVLYDNNIPPDDRLGMVGSTF